MSVVILVRHASAGSSKNWSGDDRLRPLDARGRAQAVGVVALLSGRRIDRICSSPYVRCVQTVEPLGRELGLEIEERHELAEGAMWDEMSALLDELEGVVGLLCTHGDVVELLLGESMKKCAVSILERRGGEIVVVESLPPPA